MIELAGKYSSAKVFTDLVEETAVSQIILLCNQDFTEGLHIRMMPDVHAGAGCVVGTTMNIKDKIVPNLVGVDIGCGMVVVKIKEKDIDFNKLDETIRKHIPSGSSVRGTRHPFFKLIAEDLNKLHCFKKLKHDRVELSLGSLGGGNHFIEINKGKDDSLYLVIHSGSRGLGKQVAELYQDIARKECDYDRDKLSYIINELKQSGRVKEITSAIEEFKKTATKKVVKDLEYLEGESFTNYIDDMRITQKYATINRDTMAQVLVEKMGWNAEEKFTTIHNYIDMDNMILRKGAVSAQSGEKLIIPINMRDGSLLCVGKGNADWNYSAPHGAGRTMSRTKAKEQITLDQFKDSMKGIFSNSILDATIDEAPMAYKPIKSIIDNIGDTVEIIENIKPVFNFKAS